MLDLFEARTQVEYLGAMMAKAQGADVEIPSLEACRDQWEKWLRSEPERRVLDEEGQILYEALFPKRRDEG